jgi:hypothetical protein
MSTPKHTHVVSSTPERTRLRVSRKRRNPEEMARIAKALKAHSEVHDVRTNVETGSIVVHHAHNDNSLDEISAVLQDLGVILGSAIDVDLPSSEGKSEVATTLTDAISDLNDRVGTATDGVVDLRMLVPAGFAALALRQLLENGWEIETIPWYALAWYAFDSFIKLHYSTGSDETQTKTE